jgi:hypothetical protein
LAQAKFGLGRRYESIILCLIRHERGLRVYENRVLRRIFAPKRDEVSAKWRKIHNEEL